jgi:cyclic pyranopterin monophosphate synthase
MAARKSPRKTETRSPTHLDARGHVHVVDVGAKAPTRRRAEARAVIVTTAEVAAAISDGKVPKGDVAAVARIAAITGAKKTSDLVPLCHPLPLTHLAVEIDVVRDGEAGEVHVHVTAECVGPTGVEMEAMTGASIGALAIYDMIKGLDRGASIARVELLAKSGGRSGDWRRA